MNLFEAATRQKYRFETAKGLVSVEELWDLNLVSLDIMARSINKQIKESEEESFIKPMSNKDAHLVNKLELLKHIINVRLEEKEASKSRAEKQAQLNTLKEIAARKADEVLTSKSLEEIQAMIEKLESE